MQEEFDIFNVDPSVINTHNQKKTSTIYNPRAKDVPSGIYDSTIRFLYNPKNPADSIIRKVVYYLKDADGSGKYFDSYQSNAGGWKDCVIGQLYSKLSKSESALDRKNADELSRRDQYYSLVQIVDDKVKPELNGKIMIFKYGIKLKKKLDMKLEPDSGERDDIMNFFTGKDFKLYITRQGNYNEYSECHFETVSKPIGLNGSPVENTDEGKAALRAYLGEAPDVSTYKFKEWDAATRAEAERILNLYRNPSEQVSTIVNDTQGTQATAPKSNAGSAADILGETKAPAPVTPAPVAQAAPVAEVANAAAEDGDIDGFLNDMGI